MGSWLLKYVIHEVSMEKRNPWLSESERALFPPLDEKILLGVLAFRDQLDYLFGTGLNPHFILAQNWGVGIIPHRRDDEEDEEMRRVFDYLGKEYREFGFALPGKSPSFGAIERSPETSNFSPPLVTRFNINYTNYTEIRGGMVGIYNGNFLLFPDSRSFCYLEVGGHYSLLGAPNEVLCDCIGKSYQALWKEVVKSFFGNALSLNLKILINEYGYGELGSIFG